MFSLSVTDAVRLSSPVSCAVTFDPSGADQTDVCVCVCDFCLVYSDFRADGRRLLCNNLGKKSRAGLHQMDMFFIRIVIYTLNLILQDKLH